MSEQTIQTELVSDGIDGEIVQPQKRFSNVQALSEISSLMPKYRGMNPLHINNQLLSNESFLNEFIDDYFQLDEVRNLTTEQRLPEDKKAFKLGLRDVLTQGAYSGVAPSESIINRSAEKTQSIKDIPAKDYRSLIEKNPDKYRGFDIITEDGKLAYQNNNTFAQHVLEDPQLKQTLMQDRYEQFSNELAKGHNPTALIADNPNKLAKAYAVYDKFGSEGLTQYTNYIQFKEQGIPEGVPSNQFIQAGRFVENATYNGKSLDDVVVDFIGRTEEDRIRFEEIQPNLDIENTIPKDLNYFSAPYYEMDSQGNFSEKPSTTKIIDVVNEFYDDLLKDESDLEEFNRHGERSDEYGKMTWAIFSALENEEAGFSYQDLFDTVMANYDNITDRDGNPVFHLNYNEAPFHVQTALDVIKHHPQYAFMLRNETDGVVSFEPERMERGSWLGNLMSTTKKLVTDESGRSQIVEEIDKSIWGQVKNSTKTLGLGVLQDLGRILGEPIARGLHNMVDSETTNSMHEWIETRTGMTAPEVIDFEQYGNAVGTAGMVAPFVSYLGGMWGIGRAAIRGGASALSRITQAKVAHDVAKYGTLMQGTRTWQRRSQKLNHAIANKADWVAGFGIYESGAAVIEATQPARHSFFNTLPAMVTGDNANVVSEFYQKASGSQRVAMDVAGSIMFGTLADTMIKGLSFGAANAARAAGKKDTFKSIIFDPKDGQYVVTNQPQFRSDYRKFWHNFRNELNRIPEGSITDSNINAYAGRGFMKNPHNVETFNDFTKSFVDNSGEFAGGIRRDIEEQIRFYENNYASRHADGFRLSDQEVTRMVDEQYSNFINSTAQRVRSVLADADAIDPDQLTRRFADSLGEVAPTTRQITEVDGRPAHVTDAPALRKQGKSIIERGDELFEVDGHYWATDLANELRHMANKGSRNTHLDQKINQRLQSEGITNRQSARGKEIEQEVSNQVNAYYGVPVRDGNGNLGYIVDRTDGGYTIRTDLGFEESGARVQVTDERLDQIVEAFERSQVTREQGEMIRQGNPTQGTLFELIDPNQITVTRLGGQTDRFERAHRKLAGAKTHAEKVQDQLRQNQEVLSKAGDDADRAKIQESNQALMRQLKQTQETIREAEAEIVDSRMPYGSPLRETPDGQSIQYQVRNRRGEVIDLDQTIEIERRNIDVPRQTRLFGEKFNKHAEEYRRIAEENTPEQRQINVDDVGGSPIFSRQMWEKLSEAAGRNISKTKTSARNILQNIGLPDNRWRSAVYTTKSGNKKRLLGKNAVEVDITEYDVTAGRVGSNVMVSRMNKTGRQDFFLSTKSTEIEPSRVIESEGRPVINPDWDGMNRNVTFDNQGNPVLYKRDPDGTYRPLRKGEEDGVYINVQRPYKGAEISNSDIIDQDIDGIIVGPNRYRLVDEQNQTINPRTIDELKERRTLDVETSRELPDVHDIAERVTQAGVPQGIAMAIALSAAGSLADDGEAGMGTYGGGAIGFLLGFPRVRSRITGSFRRGKRRDQDSFREFAKKKIDDNNLAEASREAKRLGYEGDLNNPESIQNFFRDIEPITQAKSTGKSVQGVWKAMMSSSVVQSGKEFFSSVGGPVAKKMGDVLDRWHGHAAVTERRITDRILEAVEVDGVSQEVAEAVRGGRFNDVSVRVVRNIFGDDIPEDRAIKMFGDSMKRIITHEADVDSGGRFLFAESPSASREYASQVARDVDRQILSTPEGRALRDGIRQGFDDVADSNIEILNTRAREILQSMERESVSRSAGMRALKEFVEDNSDMSYRQFKKLRSPEERKQLSMIMNEEPNATTLREYKNSSVRINNMKGRYYPQIINREGEPQRFQNFVRDNASELEGLSEAQRRELFNRRESERILEMNNDKFDLLEIDADGMDVSPRAFTSKKQAQNELERLISAREDTGVIPIADADVRRMVRSHINNNEIDRYLRSRTVKGKTHYYLTTPQSFKDQGLNLYREKNVTELGSAHESFTKHSLVKKSHFIDSPRKYIMPNDMLTTDVQEVINRYSYDAGRRMYAVQNKIANVKELNEHWMSRIAREIEEKVEGAGQPEAIKNAKDKLTTWYKIAAKTHDVENYGRRGLDADQLVERYRNQEGAERQALTWRKFSTAPFLYATTFYSWLTPAILGTFLTSGRSIASGYKMAISDPQQFRRWSDEIRRTGVLKEMLHAIRPELQRMGAEITDSAGDAGAIHRLADKGAEISSELSFSKPIYKALGIDYENTGALRLVTGNMFDISGAETTITVYAGLRELDKIARTGKKLFDRMKQNDNLTPSDRREFAQIERRMTEMGIDNPTRFMEGHENLENYIQGMGEGRRLTPDQMDSWVYDQITQSMNTLVDNYHGRTIMSRGTAWLDNPVGRVLSTFSVYAQNFGQQTLLGRIYRPMRDFHRNFGEEADMSAFRLHTMMKRGNENKLREVFGDRWQEAFEQYPVEVYDNIFRVFATLGLGKVLLMSRAAMLDVTSIMANESLQNPDYERWRNLNRQWTVNPRASEEDQFTFGELFSGDRDGFDQLRLIGSTLATANDMGFFTRLPQMVQQIGQHPQGGPLAATPTGGIAHNFAESASRSFNAMLSMDMERMSTDIPREFIDTALFMTPGAGTFFDARKAVVDTVVPRREQRRGRTIFDPITGQSRDGGRMQSTAYY